MKLKTSELTTERKWRSATGLDKKRFYTLLPLFSASYIKTYGRTLAEKQEDVDSEFCIQTEEELLYFILFSLKSGLIYDLLGIVSGMDGSNAKRQQAAGLEVLDHALQAVSCMPKRNLLNKNEFEAFLEDFDALFIDATEQRIQRPKDKETQEECYSGKKKAHTLKSMMISTAKTYIKYLSPSVNGKIHDFNLLKQMFNPDINWFEKFKVTLDSAYTGFDKIYRCKSVAIPYKKSKNNPLSDEKKQFNKELSSQRIVVEHCIGGMKRYHILSNRLRLHDINLYDKILGICAGLWNFYLSN